MIATCEVDADIPFQSEPTGRPEEQQRLEHRLVDEEPEQFLYAVAQMVEIHTQDARVSDERGVAAVSEDARRCHVVEVSAFEVAGFILVCDKPELLGLRSVPWCNDTPVNLEKRQWLLLWPLVCDGLLEETHSRLSRIPACGGCRWVVVCLHTNLIFL